MRCELISWGELQRLCRRLAGRIQAAGFRPDIIVAIIRGGYVPAKRIILDSSLDRYLGLDSLARVRYRTSSRSMSVWPEAARKAEISALE